MTRIDIMTPQEAIDKLTALCPCEIRYIKSNEVWSEDTFLGCYRCAYLGKLARVEISSTQDLEQTASSIAHEVSHAICDQSKCRCTKRKVYNNRSTQLSEFHAMLFELRWLLGNQCIQPLNLSVKDILLYASDYFNGDYKDMHSGAAIRIMETKLWQKCLIACDIEQVLEPMPA